MQQAMLHCICLLLFYLRHVLCQRPRSTNFDFVAGQIDPFATGIEDPIKPQARVVESRSAFGHTGVGDHFAGNLDPFVFSHPVHLDLSRLAKRFI